MNSKEISTYNEDGREPLSELYEAYDKLLGYGFSKEPIYTVKFEAVDGTAVEVTCYCYKSAIKGPSLWVLSGVHGEEVAGPDAIAQNIDILGEIGRQIPLVICPMLNPKGYCLNWRYPDEKRDWHKGHSVGDPEYVLPDLNNPTCPRVAAPSSEIALKVTEFILETIKEYPPILTSDHHEDEALERSYIYSQGLSGADDEVAKEIIVILKGSGISLQESGLTRFGEPIKGGIVVDKDGQPVRDGSIDELLGSADKIILDGKVVQKPIARTALVIETPTINLPLEKRVEAHGNILKQLKILWETANR